jgi:hypothetical protein
MKRIHDAIGWWNRLLTLWRRGRRARDIDDEIAFHLAMRQAEHERDGLAPELARLTAARQFGNVTALKEQTRDMWTFPFVRESGAGPALRAAHAPPRAGVRARRGAGAGDRDRRDHRHVQPRSTRCSCAACPTRRRIVSSC